MRLFFFAHLTSEERKEIVARQLDSVEQVLIQRDGVRPEIEIRADRSQYLCFQFGLRFFRDMARNLSEIVEALEGSPD